MAVYSLDYETSSCSPLKKVGAWAYSKDLSTFIRCLVVRGEGVTYIFDKVNFLSGFDHVEAMCNLFRHIHENGHTLSAFNSMFEYSIYQNVHKLLAKDSWVDIPLEKWKCTQARALEIGLPGSLDKVCESLGLPGKDAKGHRIMMKYCKPRKETKHDKSLWHKKPEELHDLVLYCARDVELEEQLDQILPHLNGRAWATFQLTQETNLQGVQVDREAIKKGLDHIDQEKKALNSECSTLTQGIVTKATQNKVLLRLMQDNGYPHSNMTEDTLKTFLASDNENETLKRLVEIRLGVAKTSNAKLDRMMLYPEEGGITGILQYHGAHTGRYAARGVQFQNLTKGKSKLPPEEKIAELYRTFSEVKTAYPDIQEFVSGCIRNFITPKKPDESLVVFDYSSIEARIVLWLAGEAEALELIENGGDIYCDMASHIFGREITTKNDPDERFLGKSAVLGCGYGMGPARFLDSVQKNIVKFDLRLAIDVDMDLATKCVRGFRKKFYRVPRLWKDLENGMVNSVATGKDGLLGNLEFLNMAGFGGGVKLPSGRVLYYPRGKAIHGERGLKYTYYGERTTKGSKKLQWLDIWGGTFLENISQAISADVLNHAMLSMGGYLVPYFHVHDEVVYSVPDIKLQEWFDHIRYRLTSGTPVWANGLPIAVDGWTGKRYKK